MLQIKFKIGHIIKLLREQADLDQSELGVDKGTISKIELGQRSPKAETLEKIAYKLKTTPAEIYFLAEVLSQRAGIASSGARVSEGGVCPDGDPAHGKMHEMLESVLHGDDQRCINAVIAVLEAATGGAPPNSSAHQRGGNNEMSAPDPESVAPGGESASRSAGRNASLETKKASAAGRGFIDARTGKIIGRGKPD